MQHPGAQSPASLNSVGVRGMEAGALPGQESPTVIAASMSPKHFIHTPSQKRKEKALRYFRPENL